MLNPRETKSEELKALVNERLGEEKLQIGETKQIILENGKSPEHAANTGLIFGTRPHVLEKSLPTLQFVKSDGTKHYFTADYCEHGQVRIIVEHLPFYSKECYSVTIG